MLYRVTGIRTPVQQPEPELPGTVASLLRVHPADLISFRILRKSLDARHRCRLEFVYSVAVDLQATPRTPAAAAVELWTPKPFFDPDTGTEPLEHRPVVVGSGPAGLLAGYYLALRGYRPLILERGRPVRERVEAIRAFDRGAAHQEENNYLFGEGGAGCFSDGKLTCRNIGPDADWVLQRFVECGGPASLVYEHRPHLGSNRLPLICRNFRRRIEALGGEYRFSCRLEGLHIRQQRLVTLQTSSGTLPAEQCVLAVGHSARDTYQILLDAGLPMRPKAFQLGLRIEHPQESVNNRKYGHAEYLNVLGAADYSLVARGERDLYTFCMCAGGVMIPSISEPGMFCTNGMSNSRQDTPWANSGLVVTLTPDQFGKAHPLAGVELQRTFERRAFEYCGDNYFAPLQRANEFLADRYCRPSIAPESSYRRGTYARNLAPLLPPAVLRAVRGGLPVLNARWNGCFLTDAVLSGPEMRGSSPVRIERNSNTMQVSGLAGVYPVGEGAGYAGGIVTAAVDGLRAARNIVRRLAPPAG